MDVALYVSIIIIIIIIIIILFSSSFSKSACPTRALWRFDVFADVFFSNLKTWGSHLAMSTDDRFLPQGSVTHTLDRVAYV